MAVFHSSSRRVLMLRPLPRAVLVAALAVIGLLAVQITGATAAREETIVLRQTVNPGDGYPTGRYLYMPFTVPEGTNRVAVKVTHNGNQSLDKIGAGLFDERGAGYQGGGFRGIYGEERGEFFVSANEASQSFNPGRIKAGQWTVLVPVFRTGPNPFTVTATVTLSMGDQPEGAGPGQDLGVVDERPGWYRGDLHVHTNESSDAFASMRALEAREYGVKAREAGLDWVPLTDHNVTSQNRDLAGDHQASGTLVLGGEEMTNWFHGHATVTGLEPGDHIDWRQRPASRELGPNEARIQRFIEEVRKRDVYTAVAHPYGAVLAWQFFGDAKTDPRATLPEGLEVWTGPFQPDDQASIEQWDELLNEGIRIFANGGSDVHGFNRGDGFALAQPTTVTYAAQLSKRGIVDGLKQGRSFITRVPDGVELYLTGTGPGGQRQPVGGTIYGGTGDLARMSVLVRRGAGGRLVVLRDGEEVQATPISSAEQTVTFDQPVGRGGFVRVELRRDPAVSPAGQPISSRLDMEALTNPIFLVNGPLPPGTQPVDAPPPAQAGPRRPPASEGDPDGSPAGPPEQELGRPAPAPVSPAACLARSAFQAAAVRPRGRGLAFEFAARSSGRVRVEVARRSAGRRLTASRVVARFERRSSFSWRGRGGRVGDGYYVVRYRALGRRGAGSVRQVAVHRSGGRFGLLPSFDRAEPCGPITSLRLDGPAFGGRSDRPLDIAYRLRAGRAQVRVELLRGRRVIRRLNAGTRRAGVTHRLRLRTDSLARGTYRVRLVVRQGDARVQRTVVGARL